MWSQKFFRGQAPGPPSLLASLAFGISTPNVDFIGAGLTTGPHPRKIVLCMVVNMDPSQTSQINPTLFHYSLRASCKRKKGENEHYCFSEVSGPWPPLIDRCHDAPALKVMILRKLMRRYDMIASFKYFSIYRTLDQ